MNRMIKLFQQKSNRKFDEYLLARKKSLSPAAPVTLTKHVDLGEIPLKPGDWKQIEDCKGYPTFHDILCATLKAESDCWAKAADLLRKEELSK